MSTRMERTKDWLEDAADASGWGRSVGSAAFDAVGEAAEHAGRPRVGGSRHCIPRLGPLADDFPGDLVEVLHHGSPVAGGAPRGRPRTPSTNTSAAIRQRIPDSFDAW
jgi:hypothetical protein